MYEIVIILLGIFILIMFIILFALLYYVNDNYIKYNNEVNDNLYKSEQVINDTNKAFNKLQDNVINKIATVNSNQEAIINNNNTAAGKISTNLLNVMDIENNNVRFSNLTSNIIDNSKSLNVNLKPDITTYKNISTLTNNSNLINICNNEVDAAKRKCVNINVDDSGVFNIYTANKLNSSNIANISIRDTSNNVMASFDGANKKISLGSNVNPAISIENNLYTPDIIVCKYTYFNTPAIPETPAIPGTPATATSPATQGTPAIPGTPAVKKISMTLISNFDIKPFSYLNFIIPENFISGVIESSGYKSPSYTSPILKLQNITAIPKNTITNLDIQVNYISEVLTYNFTPMPKFNTNAYITLS
jgi:hypothetical protein